jgi:cell wall assembly regulator SMI1
MDRTRRKLLVGILATFAVSLLPAACGKRKGSPTGSEKGAPKRPPGRPKPALKEDIAPTLARLDAWYAAHLPADRYVFNPPAKEADLDAVESVAGITLPAAYRQLYRWHDGEDGDRFGHIYGLPLLPLAEVRRQWIAWNEVLKDFGGDRYKIPGGVWPQGAVDPAYINPHWIPLTHDGSGNHIGLDFDPWPAGRIGQVILYGRDEDVKAVLAPSLGTFLQWIVGLLESGNFRLQAEPNVLHEFRLKDPPSDSFYDGARTLLGAPGPFL